jgi:two-component system, cell cycle sensor histidine kinase and response regulator CckA
VETMPDGVAVHVAGSVAFVNDTGARIFGFGHPQGLLGRSLVDFIHPDHRVEFTEALRRLEAHGTTVHTLATVIRRPDGTSASIEVSATTLDYGGSAATQFIFRDVTERERTREALREAGEQLRQSQKLEAVGRLAGGIAHDFNNLLTVITAFSQMVLDSLAVTDSRYDDLLQVRQAADRAADLTRQLLAFSRKQVMHPRVIDLNTVVREVDRMLRRVIGDDVVIETDLAPEGATIHADRGQIEQVIMNLAVNARDAMVPAGGVIEIRTEVVELTRAQGAQLVPPAPPGRYAVLAVRDTGHGMSADVMRHIFDPFYTTKDVGSGTGLGLSMVYGIVQQSQGALQVISAPGAGAVFRLHFPHVAPAPQAAAHASGDTHRASGNETILLVEDEDGVRAAAQRVLESRGFRVFPARNGEDAMRVLLEDPQSVDLLLTDLVMPGMGGRELSEQALGLNPALKVLYMTGYSADGVSRRGAGSEIRVDDNQILTKPFTMASLPDRVRAALDS